MTWGLEQSLETAVRTHVASLLLNAKHLESEWKFQPSGSGEDKFGDILLIQPTRALYFNNLLHVLEDKNLNRVIYNIFQI